MIDINQKILQKIYVLIGDNAPEELKEFFKEILELETKQETQQKESSAIKNAYKTSLDKYSQEKKTLNYIKAKTKVKKMNSIIRLDLAKSGRLYRFRTKNFIAKFLIY